MKLDELLKGVEIKKTIGKTDMEITNVCIDSNQVSKGSMYICLRGENFDGRTFIPLVEGYGASVIVTDKESQSSVAQIVVDNTRKALSLISQNFFGNPSKKMKVIGVTGTNGKTTTTNFITSVMTNGGIKCGLIGTLGTFYDGVVIEPSLTTPDPMVLNKTFKDMADRNVEVVIMELSAHAIYLDKVYGIDFECVVFTNLTEDHLDFFKDMENYKNAKLKLFKENKIKYTVTNSDDEVGREILNINPKALSYGLYNPADVFAINVKESKTSIRYDINLFDMIYEVRLNLIGEFNVYNSLASATACAVCGVKGADVISGLENLKGVSGRIENVYDGEYSIFLDYAHTPDGLEKALKTVKNVTANKLVCLFGCGGNRDKNKRKIMGEISGKIADFTVITSDNPRYEDAMSIIREIENGITGITKEYVLIEDRREAIKYALSIMEEGDSLLIAGKGSEKYQEIYGIKHLFNDKDTITELLKGSD